ncbi:metal resistance protein ycf1, putative [Talaromyces stipitatus ATCC 10500]|uniref:Metal resistance protein ycf1, putative n=1 Tax=Talaromyces stipitatus (strain ATCC 10500 / CBS 375.48 / QM 6759 / NRRL 1006) TaxID=441959 RepID=B8M935_TALSN|nr:metal resistance protein ycf1, putative [Talaromyces stipitatus ATCC 10500]EED17330.1 metal resistance protein ycf1, putative [Talaromyces stipitatus ATCC 10500]
MAQLDPSGTVSDEEIIAALEKVQLWNVIKSRGTGGTSGSNTAAPSGTATPSNDETANGAITPKKAKVDPLEAPLKGSPLSHGQILILDEATGNVDARTNGLMQRIIREEFAKHTILTIAHRLDTIRSVDTILIMDKGKVVKVVTLDELLAKMARKKNAGGGEEEEEEEEEEGEEEEGADMAWFREMWDNAH